MKTLFQKITTQLPEIFHKEPPKKLIQQKKNPNIKPTLAVLTAISSLGATYLTYRYLFPKISIPNSPISNPINTALKIFGSFTVLTGLAGIMASQSTNQPNVLQNEKSTSKLSTMPSSEDENSEEENDLDSAEGTEAQNTLTENPDRKRGFEKGNPIHSDIQNLLKDFHQGEKINKDLLEKLITTYSNLSTLSPKSTVSNEIFISAIIKLIQEYKNIFYNLNELEKQTSTLNKIIDILDVFTDQTDPLSCRLVKNLFSYIIPNGLHEMTQIFIDLEDKESKDLVNRSCQLVYKAITQQMKIITFKGIDFEPEYAVDKAFKRILELLTPFKNDHFRLSPNFYTNFIHYCPELAWPFIQKYILEYIINNKPLPNLDVMPDTIIANFLNARDRKDREDKSISPYTSNDGLDILKKIVSDAQLSLFLEGDDEEAASFAIRLIQHKLNIKSEEFEKNLNDIQLLQKLYKDLRTSKDPTYINHFVTENDLTKDGTKIANILKSKYYTTSFVNELLGSDITKIRQRFIELINSLVGKTEYSELEMELIKALSCFIVFQIHDPSILQRTELASLALNQYTEIFLNTKSAKIIKKAYQMAKFVENPHLNSACQQFIETWNVQQNIKSEILEIKDLQSNIIKLNSGLENLKSNIIKLNSENTKCLIS